MYGYSELISARRNRPSSMASECRTPDQESESDRGRVIFSSPFRRLQQKAQVYSLEDNAAVRSRLTHSLEVAQTGRWIAQLILTNFRSTDQLARFGLEHKEIAFLNFVETSCLIHDLGNPPFGHLGEFALQQWFQHFGREALKSAINAEIEPRQEDLVSRVLVDFTQFDGNCQGLRIVSKLQWMQDEHGLNLTYTQLLSYLKYVVHACQVDKKDERKKKGGYFLTEERLVQDAWAGLSMTPHTRHPLAYIMEAADDIAYSISDIEDAIEKGLIRLEDFLAHLTRNINFNAFDNLVSVEKIKNAIATAQKHCDQDTGNLSPYTQFRTSITSELTKFAAEQYIDRHIEILLGTAPPIFAQGSEKRFVHTSLIVAIKTFAQEEIYPSPAASNNELAGYTVLHGLLNHYRPLLTCHASTFRYLNDHSFECLPENRPNKLQRRLFERLPNKYRRAYRDEVEKLQSKDQDASILEWLHRAHLITDYISGMTDDFSLETFQLLSGIQVGKPI